jgi:hypothetical protein
MAVSSALGGERHQMNLDELDERNRNSCGLVLRPQGMPPIGDIMLAQKLAIANGNGVLGADGCGDPSPRNVLF